MNLIVNAVLFQICWIAFVGGAARGWWWAGFVVLAVFAAWQLRTTAWPRADLAMVFVSAVLGFAMDSALVQAGLLHYVAPIPWPSMAPLWMVGLWMAFALTLNHSLTFLRRNWPLAFVIGAIAGPFAYWVAGRAWQAVTFHEPASRAYIALAIAWGVLTPLLSWMALRLVRREVPANAPAIA